MKIDWAETQVLFFCTQEQPGVVLRDNGKEKVMFMLKLFKYLYSSKEILQSQFA